MRHFSTQPVIAVLLIFALLHVQSGSIKAAPKRDGQVRAIFLGIKFENLPQDVQETLSFRISEILEYQKQFSLTKSDAARNEYGYNTIVNLVENQNSEAILAFAKDHQFDFVYSGALKNASSSEGMIQLSGELIRYDVVNNQEHRYTIDSDYAQIGNSLLDFSDKYVQTLPEVKRKSNILGSLLIGGLILVGVAAISLAIGRAGGGGEGGGERPTPGDE